MKSFTWDDKYDVGVAVFNEQHKLLLTALKDIYSAMENKQDRAAIATVLNNLLDYAKKHLIAEEECLKANKYPDLANHQLLHNNFIKKLSQFCEDFKNEKFTLHFEMAIF